MQELPAFSYEGEVIVVEEAKNVEGAVRYLAAHTCLGFRYRNTACFSQGRDSSRQSFTISGAGKSVSLSIE